MKKYRILVVDDVKEYVDALARALSDEYEVVKAYSLEEGKEKMDATIALAIVDVRLSEIDYTNRDGILLLSWLKENYPTLPVIMISAYRDFDAAVDALNLGASHFLKKPINLKELREIISQCLRKG